MEFVDVLFSDYVPDRGGAPWPENPGYLVDADGARPTQNGWVTGVDATANGTSFAGSTVLAAYETREQIFVGTTKEIWETRDKGSTWNDNKQATYSASPSDNWCFTEFDNLVIATNRLTQPQKKDTTGSAGANFADLGATTTGWNAEVACRVRDHLVLGGLSGGFGNETTVRWSSIGNPEAFPDPGSATALSNQAGSQLLPARHGFIAGIVGFERYGLVFQERAITRMTYEGGNTVYQFDRISESVGSGVSGMEGKHAFATVDGITYFPNRAGIWATDGYKVKCISSGRLDASLFSATLSHPDRLGILTSVVHDVAKRSLYFVSQASTSPAFGSNKVLAYDYSLDRFYLVPPSTLLAVFGTTASSAASLAIDGIHSAWGVAGNTLYRLDPAPASVDLQTGFIELVPGKRVQIQGAHVLGAGTTTPTIGYKGVDTPNSLSVVQTGFTNLTTPLRDITSTGRDTARYFAFRVSGAQGAGAVLRGLRIFYEQVSGK